MNLYFRFLWLMIKRFFVSKPQDDVFAPCSTTFFSNPLDIDLNLHMNNGRYLTLMDLGRMDLLMRTNMFWPLFGKGYFPVVVSESIYFRRSLKMWQKFQIITKIESIDEKDFFIIQHFVRNNDIYATGYIQGRFRKKGQKGSVATEEVFQVLSRETPNMQSELSQCQLQMHKALKENSPKPPLQ